MKVLPRVGLALLLAGCTRTFSAPLASDAGTQPPTLIAASPTAAFAGEALDLTGSGFSSIPQENQIRVAQSLAGLDPDAGAPGATQLSIVMPNLGPGAQDAQVTVSVNGLTSAPLTVRYLGPGHVASLALGASGDLSPTPTSVNVLGSLISFSTLRNRLAGIVILGGTTIPYPVGNGPTDLPFGTNLQLTFGPYGLLGEGYPDGGGTGGFALWTSLFDFSPGETQYEFLSTATTPVGTYGLQDAGVWPLASDLGDQNGLHAVLPTVNGVVIYGDGGDQGPLVHDRPERGGVLADYDQVVVLDAGVVPYPDGGADVEFEYATEVAALLRSELSFGDGGAVLLLDDVAVHADGRVTGMDGSANPVATPLQQINSNGALRPVPASTRAISTLAAAPGGVGFYAGGPFGELGFVFTAPGVPTAFTTFTNIGRTVDFMAASNEGVTVGSLDNSELDTYGFTYDDAGPTWYQLHQFQLDGPIFGLARDSFPDVVSGDFPIYAAQTTPPAIVALDTLRGTSLGTVSLSNDLYVAGMSPDGRQLAATGLRLPMIAMVDGDALAEDSAGFQHPLDSPGEPQYTEAASAVWRTANGNSEVCLVMGTYSLDQPDGGEGFLRCGPPDAIFSPAGATLLRDELTADFRNSSGPPPQAVTLPDGRVRVFTADQAFECAAGCTDKSCCQLLGTLPANAGTPSLLAATPDGRVVLAVKNQARDPDVVLVDPQAGTRTTLCDGTLCLDHSPTSLAVDRLGKRVSVLGNGSVVLSLDDGHVMGRVNYYADIPIAQAFSPDGTRLYIGTILGHLDEYDAHQDLGEAELPHLRSLSTGFSVAQVLAYPDGSRLLLTELRADKLHVVQ